MRIAVLANAFPPNAQGGAGVIAGEQVRLLEERGHDVRVFIGDRSWTNRPVLPRLMHHLVDVFAQKKRVTEILEWNPERLVTHNLTGCGWGTPSAIARTGVPWIHTLHDVQGFEPSGQMKGLRFTLWQRAWSTIRRRTFGVPSTVISPTRWLLQEYKKRGWFTESETRVIQNPAPIRSSSSRPRSPTTSGEISPLRYASVEMTEKFRLLFIGRQTPDKGDEIIQALLHDGYSVSCFADVSHDVVLRAMHEHGVLLVPSQIMENQPTVILEAFSLGLPVIASDVGGIAETVGDGGLVVPAQDIRAWKEAIQRIQDDWSVFSQKSFAQWSRFDPKNYGDVIEEVIRNASTSNR